MARSISHYIVFYYVPFSKPFIVDRWMVQTETLHTDEDLLGYPKKDVSWKAFTNLREAEQATMLRGKVLGGSAVLGTNGFVINNGDHLIGVRLRQKLSPDDTDLMVEEGFDGDTVTPEDYYATFGEYPTTTSTSAVDYETRPILLGRDFMRTLHAMRDNGFEILNLLPARVAGRLEEGVRTTIKDDLKKRGKQWPDKKSMKLVHDRMGNSQWYPPLNGPLPPVPREPTIDISAKVYRP